MRFLRPLSAGAAVLALAAGIAGPATAQSTAGVGTSLTSTKVLTAQLGENGSLLDLALLTDEAQATLDTAVAAPGSFSRLSLGKVGSAITIADVVNKQLPTFEAKSTGPTSTDVTAGALGLAEPILKGTVSGGKLTATLENGVAASGLTAEVTNVSDIVGGLLKVASAKAVNEAKGAPDASTATRSASVTDVTVLDLSALLQGLGIDIGSLTVAQVAGLLDALAMQLGVPIPAGATITSALNSLTATISTLQTTVANTTTSVLPAVESTVNDTLGTLLGTTAPVLPTTSLTDPAQIASTLTLLNDTITTLTADLNELINGIVNEGLPALDGVALLRLEGVEVAVATKAVQDINASTATITGKIGKVSIGGLTIASGLDLVAALDPITAAVNAANAKISEVLSVVDPGLANLVKVSVLEKATEVATKNGYSTATAGVTAVSATITPPATLAAIVQAVNAQTQAATDEVFEVLGVAAAEVPAELGLSTAMNTLASTLRIGFAALTQPATIRVAQVLSASNYRVGGATTTGAPGTGSPELPRTGADTVFLTAALAVILGLVARRILLSSPQPKPIRIKK